MSDPLSGSTFLEATGTSTGRYAGRVLTALGATVITADLTPDSGLGKEPGSRRVWPDSFPQVPWGRIETILNAERFDGALVSSPVDFPAGCEGVVVAPDAPGDLEWADSGAMTLTGYEDGSPRRLRRQVVSRLRGAAAVLEMVTAIAGRRVRIDGPALLGERAALQGLYRRGIASAGGAGRLIEAGDGWIVVNLPRRRDLELLSAWLGVPRSETPWNGVRAAALHTLRDGVVARGRQLGMAVAPVVTANEAFRDEQALTRGQSFPPAPWVINGHAARPINRRTRSRSSARGRHSFRRPPLVVDVSGLWAGPLCASFVLASGARVIKVEMHQRPDGTRGTDLFDLLNAGKECVALDFRHEDDRRSLRRLLEAADIVIESFRPRVMESLGIYADAWLEQGEGRVWLSITGYGRTGPGRNWVAFGDDAAVAGGAVTVVDGFEDSPVFCSDAMADPVAGLYAAIAAVAAWSSGLGHLVDVALREAVGHAVSGHVLDLAGEGQVVPSGTTGSPWVLRTSKGYRAIAAPRARTAPGRGSAIDGDGPRLRHEFSL